jgi:hypothetical protein
MGELTMRKFALCVAAGAVAVALTVSLAGAAEMRGIDFTQRLVGANGEPLWQGGRDCKPDQVPGRDCTREQQTLGDVALVALLAMIDEDKNLDPRKKFERDQLARKVFRAKNAALSAEEIALIKERIGKVLGPAQVGAAWPLLDPTLAR